MDAGTGLGALFPEDIPSDWADSAVFKLSYRQHGGSGLGLSAEYVENLEIGRVRWLLEKLDEVREQEAAALRKR